MSAIGKPRPCGCKGYRTCLICEKDFNLPPFDENRFSREALEDNGIPSYVYCPRCNLAWPGWDCNLLQQHPNHEGDPIEYPGISVEENFFTESESKELVEELDALPWELSQSGRRKQNFGPKCNFKKRKVQLGDFKGFPKFTEKFYKKLKNVPLLADYQTIEQCSLEYDPCRGAAIEPHIDDCWIWGERIVTLNLLGDGVLTMNKYLGDDSKYNLDCVDIPLPNEVPNICVRIPMPARSLMIIYNSARYQWEHSVLRRDITERRVCVALREFTKPYLQPEEESGQLVLRVASNYF